MPRIPAPIESSSVSSTRAVLVARPTQGEAPEAIEASLRELEQLLAGLGIVAVETVVQRHGAQTPNDGLGRGKVEEIRALLAGLGEEPRGGPLVLVFDGALGPAEQRRLETALDVDVLDRTGVILMVFEQRAQTDVARLEVELARLGYEAPRVRDAREIVHRQGGGGGRGERGHTNVELRKRQIYERMATLRRRLETLRKTRDVRKQRRSGMPRVALVGYTNAGKSSIMRALTGGDVMVADRLFATLGTTVRAIRGTSPRILVSDTIGFIRNLPHELIASFHSTLEEVCEADLLLHVVDAADIEWPSHLEVTRAALREIGASDRPSRVILNKIDRVDARARAELARALPNALAVSAYDPEDMRDLAQAIVASIAGPPCRETLLVPIGESRLIAEIHAEAEIVEAHYDETHARLQVCATAEALARWTKMLPAKGSVDSVEKLVELACRYGLDLEPERDALDGSGLDFRALHARDRAGTRWIVRTPRRPSVVEAARVEGRVLELVAPRLPVEVPHWRIHAHDLIAYPRLSGRPVVEVAADGEVCWNVVDPGDPKEAFVESVAQALARLQSIGVREVEAAGVPVTAIERVREALARDMQTTREVLEPSEAIWARWTRWLERNDGWPDAPALVHGDLHPGHMLVDAGGRLLGILDWTEAAATDPSVDIAVFLGCFGERATADLLLRFERAGGRTWPGLLEHAAERWAFSPVLAAAWALRNDSELALRHARDQLAALEHETSNR
jgi:GTPase